MGNKRKRYSSSDDEMETSRYSSSGSSDEDEEDLPLKWMKNVSNGGNSNSNLYDCVMESCEFCNLVFYNKYDILVHTARHIIIPVEKLELHQCSECLYHFTTIEELRFHLATKHNISVLAGVLESIVKKQPIIRCENMLTELLKAANETGKIKDSNEHNNFKASNGESNFEVNNDRSNIESKERSRNITSNNSFNEDTDENHIQNGRDIIKATNQTNNIRSRLLFEEDYDETTGYSNVPCKVDVDKFPFYDIERDKKMELEACRGKILLGNKVEKSDGVVAESVHYDDLIKAGLYRCKRCCKSFPNRYDAIVHETIHIKIKKRLPPYCCTCDRHIAGNYKNLALHVQRLHPNQPKRKYTLSSCRKCSLKYNNYYRHLRNYHLIYICHLCGKRFEYEEERVNHLREHYTECNKQDGEKVERVGTYDKIVTYTDMKIIKICECCAMFMKDKQNIRYMCIGEHSKVGERQTCEKCKKEFFAIKMIKVIKRIRDDKESTYKKNSSTGNENKLKSFKKRLQMLNKLTRI